MSNRQDTEQDFLDQEWFDRLGAQLRESESGLDKDTLARLHHARRKALDTLPQRDHQGNYRPINTPVLAVSAWQTWLMPAGGVAATALIAVLVFQLAGVMPEEQSPFSNETLSVMNDMEILTAPDDLEMYQDLEFYEWLAFEKETDKA